MRSCSDECTANYRSAVSDLTLIAGEEEVEEYQPVFTYYGFRYLSIVATDDVVIHDVKGKFIGNIAIVANFTRNIQLFERKVKGQSATQTIAVGTGMRKNNRTFQSFYHFRYFLQALQFDYSSSRCSFPSL